MSEYVFIFILHHPLESFPIALPFRSVPTIDQIIDGIRATCPMLDHPAVTTVMRRELTPGMLASVEGTLLERAFALDFQGIHLRLDDGVVFAFQRAPLR